MSAKLKKNDRVNLIRAALATALIESLPSFVFYNPGVIHAVKGARVCVSWVGTGYLWFDSDAVEIATPGK